MLKKTCKCGTIISYEKQHCNKCLAEIEKKRKEHQKKYDQEIRYKRDKKYHVFYKSDEWKRVKTLALVRDKGLCQWCLKEGRVRSADVVHHIQEIKKMWEKRLSLDNLVSLCHECHNRHHNKR
ncbi:5-methylcytosine-specific restriction enzyme A [Alkalithermobacter thermoalcaliphilus JW-YL-7 = DSM 7308]|uniref:Putative HNH nuclease YajD n=1 Tax=Alkalithermobacter thermoalcaliphilus JW-YL-7 = DSM 7308 TaxID=1121328 RepID=A0A150FQZ6_CLOPD|nr:HNH endonuclease [[Clostridium] paradoxum JW-YL-7 = DSM 7308]SHL13382.1 5-methylcytosine-specific restriction enzyme A [[Clostridium] paradoxum JW-YL-7 = DSM 7308]